MRVWCRRTAASANAELILFRSPAEDVELSSAERPAKRARTVPASLNERRDVHNLCSRNQYHR